MPSHRPVHRLWGTNPRPPNTILPRPSPILLTTSPTPMPTPCSRVIVRNFHSRARKRLLPPQKIPLHGGLWKYTPFEERPLAKIRLKAEIQRNLAIAKRWNGRRSLFLGNYKNRRDGAFASQDHTGINIETLRDPVLDRVFERKVERRRRAWGCVCRRGSIREFGSGDKFGIDFDLSGIDLFVQAARRELSGKSVDLASPIPKFSYPKPKSTNWPDARKSRRLSQQLHTMMRKLLRNDEALVIRAVYQFLIDNYRSRPYLPGLLRLMIKALTLRDEWSLLQYLCSRAAQKHHRKGDYMLNKDVGSLVSHAISLSLKSKKGFTEVGHLYRFARRERREDPQSKSTTLNRSSTNDLLHSYGKVPAIFQIDNPSSKGPSEAKGRKPPGSIYPYLADANIRLHLANGDLLYAIKTMELLAQSHHVPHYKTINTILREMIRVYNNTSSDPSNPSMSLSVNRPPLRQKTYVNTVRTYHTAIPVSNVSSTLTYLSYPWLQRTFPWLGKWHSRSCHPEKQDMLDRLLRYLNENNVHSTTIKLLAKLCSTEAELEIPWNIARRAKHPKTIIRQTQAELLSAACRISIPNVKALHIKAARPMVMIMRLEGMGITPSKDALPIALTSCVERGNLVGARALMDRFEYYGYTLEQKDVIEILELLPCLETNALMTPAGTLLSPMFVRMEQLDFVMELRGYITDVKVLGPYVRAVGRCGSSVEIWNVWELMKGKEVKDGVLTAIVESFVNARNVSSAMVFVKAAHKEGYPLNFLRIKAIAGGITKGQRWIANDLLREIIVQKLDPQRIGRRFGEILCLILSSQRDPYVVPQEEIIDEVAGELEKMLISIREGTHIPEALDEMDRILDTVGQGN